MNSMGEVQLAILGRSSFHKFTPVCRSNAALNDSLSFRTADGRRYRTCANSLEHQVCNWMVAQENEIFCVACCLNRTIPDLSQSKSRALWHRL